MIVIYKKVYDYFCFKNYSTKRIIFPLIFNKIWNGSFPKKWNSASIVSIPKKGDLSDCSNYRGISLINVLDLCIACKGN